MTYTTSHLIAIMTRLSNETARHGDNPKMSYYLDGIKKEIAAEEKFLASHGVNTYSTPDVEMTDEELFAELDL